MSSVLRYSIIQHDRVIKALLLLLMLLFSVSVFFLLITCSDLFLLSYLVNVHYFMIFLNPEGELFKK